MLNSSDHLSDLANEAHDHIAGLVLALAGRAACPGIIEEDADDAIRRLARSAQRAARDTLNAAIELQIQSERT